MHVVFQVTSGNQTGQKILLRHGQKIVIGRADVNDFAFPDDQQMSRQHFSVEFSAAVCRLQNLSKRNVTKVNGQETAGSTELSDGDEVIAGQTCFNVVIEGVVAKPKVEKLVEPPGSVESNVEAELDKDGADSKDAKKPLSAIVPIVAVPVAVALPISDENSMAKEIQPASSSNSIETDSGSDVSSAAAGDPPAEEQPPAEWKPTPLPDLPLEGTKRLIYDHLLELNQPLFAVLDAARDSMVWAWLLQSDNEHKSLFEGTAADAMAALGPYLVSLPADSNLLKRLIEFGWGESWRIYLASNKSFEDMFDHLQQFVFVETDEGKEVVFRFYDPRVLRVFLPTSIPKEAVQFFGPVLSFYLEDENPENLLQFSAGKKGAKQVVPLEAALDLQGTEKTPTS